MHNDTYPLITAAGCNHSGRAVFITGASKGIGRATAISFAQAGASYIAIAARSNLEGVEAAIIDAAKAVGHPTPLVLRFKLDISDEKGVATAAFQTEQSFGRLDVLVNNAGRLENWRFIGDSDPASWWLSWEVNFKGTYLMTRAFLPLLLKGAQKTIVNMSSIGAHLTRPGASAYQTGKLAMLRLTQFTAVEYAKDGIIAIGLHPGAVPTEMVLENLPPDLHHKLVDSPELAADTIAWLTQQRRVWLSGRYLSASWDMDEIMSREDEIVQGDKLKVRLVL